MKLKELLEMSMQDLRDAEYVIEYMFKNLGLDVIWTTHFKERIEGREADVSKEELIGAFRKLKDKYGARLLQAKENHTQFIAVLKDLATDLNIPFAVDFDRRNPQNNKYHLRGITIMRKDPKQFRTSIAGGQELKVEAEEVEDEHYVDLPKSQSKKKSKNGKKRPYPTTSKSQNKVINMLWNYNNADAT